MSAVFFHAGFQRFAGGYVGVDVFFVISGYLITKLIKDQIAAGTFSFGTFYLRRARRLFPAMIATYMVTAVVAVLLFAPPYLERFGGELIHAMGSVSNIFFWLEADYFDAGAKLKPLLHTWSLSVEEQFYLIWPLILVLALRVRGRWLAPSVLAALSILSLLANDAAIGGQALIVKDFQATELGQFFAATDLPGGKAAIYFLLPFRVFEFGFGAILVWLERLRPKRQATLDVVMLVGLGLVVYSITKFDEHTLFPWFNAIPPCLGTAMLVYAGRGSRVGKIIGMASGLGKISYSVYLVHWPIIVFTEYWLVDPPRNGIKNTMVVASIILGWALYRYIETPFRHPKTNSKPVPGMVSAADATFGLVMFASAAAVFIGASSMWKYDGWKWRVPERYAYSAEEFHQKFWGGVGYPTGEFVQFGTTSKHQVLMFGDSFGLQYAKALDEIAKDGNIGFTALFHHGCPILPNIVRLVDGVENKACSDEYQKAKAAMAANPTKDVVLALFWPGYKDQLMRRGEKTPLKLVSPEEYHALLLKEVDALIADGGQNRRYFIVGAPNPSFNSIACLGSSAFLPRHCTESIVRADIKVNTALRSLAKRESNVFFIDPNDAICDQSKCMAIKDGEPIYSDGSHLSVAGAAIVAPYIVREMTQ